MPHSAEVKLEEMRAAEIRAHGEFMGRDLSPGSVPYFPDSYVPDVGS